MRFSARLEKAQDKVNIFNLGTDEYCEVNDSVGWITEALGTVRQSWSTRAGVRDG